MFWRLVFLISGAVCAVGLDVIVGGFTDVDGNNEQVQNALNFAITEHNKASNDLYLSQKTDVVKVQRQVVSGMKYVITVKLAKTSCRKGGSEERCDIFQDPVMAKPYQCTFTVWSRPWLQSLILTEEKCST
ncbi:cystatin C (amyloid angiopathy and cerebral hemorrhage) [Dunckerocampus dactyliophorus]|uniref:cystatin C (amyloid angiopathy and cerebral hemorrhage) n=1 Tax=Dunckerocampus dactyliophorus TaxID=161453 RepID=UPI0024054C66|nr:cystatin C (amyloid angiopathy and cerebral hemorrhage) [Dunckerocampus dactyliophorus]